MPYLLQGLVVHETRSILWDLQLALLYMLAKLPTVLSAPSNGCHWWLATFPFTYMLAVYIGGRGTFGWLDTRAGTHEPRANKCYLRPVCGRMSCWRLEVEADILEVPWQSSKIPHGDWERRKDALVVYEGAYRSGNGQGWRCVSPSSQL